MALQYISTGDGKVAIGSDSVTNERGFLIKVLNKTGETSVKGKVVVISSATDFGVTLLPASTASWRPSVGVIAESGIADGSLMWIWVSGSICKILTKNGINTGGISQLITSSVDGRVDALGNQNTSISDYSKIVASCMEVVIGTNETLVLGLLK